MQSLKWFIAGAVGGVIGAAIWVAVVHYTKHEVIWVALGIGFLVGFSVRMAAGEIGGLAPGVVAGATAFVTLLIAKFLVAILFVSHAVNEIPVFTQVTPDDMVAGYALEFAEEQESMGKPLNWPIEQLHSLKLPPKKRFPKDIWAEAQKRWQSLSPEEQEQKTEDFKAYLKVSVKQLEDDTRGEVFLASFSPWDLLFFGLAVLTAFMIGSVPSEQVAS